MRATKFSKHLWAIIPLSTIFIIWLLKYIGLWVFDKYFTIYCSIGLQCSKVDFSFLFREETAILYFIFFPLLYLWVFINRKNIRWEILLPLLTIFVYFVFFVIAIPIIPFGSGEGMKDKSLFETIVILFF